MINLFQGEYICGYVHWFNEYVMYLITNLNIDIKDYNFVHKHSELIKMECNPEKYNDIGWHIYWLKNESNKRLGDNIINTIVYFNPADIVECEWKLSEYLHHDDFQSVGNSGGLVYETDCELKELTEFVNLQMKSGIDKICIFFETKSSKTYDEIISSILSILKDDVLITEFHTYGSYTYFYITFK
jgi:hypothetical protein